ncbi:MAG: hypothetical protein AAF797_11915 [Planctomycetota bacterium]
MNPSFFTNPEPPKDPHADDQASESEALPGLAPEALTDEGTPDDDPQSMPLMTGIGAMGGDGESADPLNLDAAPKPKKLSPTAIALVVVLGISAAALFAMKMTSGPQSVDASTADAIAQIDSALQRFTNPDKVDANDPLHPDNLEAIYNTSDLIEQFDLDRTEKNVPVEEVQKNPFRLEAQKAADPVDPDAALKAEQARLMEEQAKKLAALRSEFQTLTLQSVMNGPNPIAVINGDFLRVGATVGSFTITRIDRLTVTLEADDVSYDLSVKR